MDRRKAVPWVIVGVLAVALAVLVSFSRARSSGDTARERSIEANTLPTIIDVGERPVLDVNTTEMGTTGGMGVLKGWRKDEALCSSSTTGAALACTPGHWTWLNASSWIEGEAACDDEDSIRRRFLH
jgi:hypothetical protein